MFVFSKIISFARRASVKRLGTEGRALFVNREGFPFWRSGEKYFRTYSEAVPVEISHHEYLLQKFWIGYENVLPFLEDEEEEVRYLSDGAFLTCGFRDYYFQWFDANGNRILKRDDIGNSNIYGFCMDGDGIWYAMPEIGTVERFSLSENKVTHSCRSLFEYPDDIALVDGILYVCDPDKRTVFSFDPTSGTASPYLSLGAPVWKIENSKIGMVLSVAKGIHVL